MADLCVLASREFGGAENGLDALKGQQFKCNLFVDDGQSALTRYRDLDIVGRHVDGGIRWVRCIGDPHFESTGRRIRSRATRSIAVLPMHAGRSGHRGRPGSGCWGTRRGCGGYRSRRGRLGRGLFIVTTTAAGNQYQRG